jgi:hypothetical protein
MQDKFELSEEFLPQDIHNKVEQLSATPDLLNFAMTSKGYFKLFKPMLDVRKLLLQVVRGKHAAVQTMLKNDISLAFKRGKVTDYSGRTFEDISAFEYLLWALDKHMWAQVLDCIPKNEKGNEILAELLSQYKKVITEGVSYELNGKIIREHHFDFASTIIKALQRQIDYLNTCRPKNLDTIDEQWREGVGGAQKLLPMHVVYEYCSDIPFEPLPQFTSQPKSSMLFYNWLTEKNENWFADNSMLGVDFAIYKGLGKVAESVDSARLVLKLGSRLLRDLAALTALCKVRTMDFINLNSQLEELKLVDNELQDYCHLF